MKVDIYERRRRRRRRSCSRLVNVEWYDVDGEVNDTYRQQREETKLRTGEKEENKRHESEREIEKSVMCKYVYNAYRERERKKHEGKKRLAYAVGRRARMRMMSSNVESP